MMTIRISFTPNNSLGALVVVFGFMAVGSWDPSRVLFQIVTGTTQKRRHVFEFNDVVRRAEVRTLWGTGRTRFFTRYAYFKFLKLIKSKIKRGGSQKLRSLTMPSAFLPPNTLLHMHDASQTLVCHC